MEIRDTVKYRLIITPCCLYKLRWINQGLPTYCPNCGKSVQEDLKKNPVPFTEAVLTNRMIFNL